MGYWNRWALSERAKRISGAGRGRGAETDTGYEIGKEK